MGIIMNFLDRFGADPTPIDCDALKKETEKLSLSALAYSMGVNRIASTLAKAEFKTYTNGEEVKKTNYYRLNVAPSRNYDKVSWIKKLIHQLFWYGEALILKEGKQLVIAESFEKKRKALVDWVFSDIESDEYPFKGFYFMKDVVYVSLNNKNVKGYLDSLYSSYAEILGTSKDNFIKSGGIKGIVNLQSMQPGTDKDREKNAELLKKQFRALFENRNAIAPLPMGYSFQNLSDRIESLNTSRDFKAIIDDVFNITGAVLNIPPAVIRGELSEKDQAYLFYLSECIDPIAQTLEAALNKSYFTETEYLRGDRIKVDTSRLEHFSIFRSASAIDKLIASSMYSVNELREKVGDSKVDEGWADKHILTQNYKPIDEIEQKGEDNAEDSE